jgi:capsid portal protein
MKKEKLSHGDVFYLELPGNIYVRGRVLFDVKKQYHKLVDYDALPDSQQNYFHWYADCQLVEIYKGVYSSVSQMNSSAGEVIIPVLLP